MMRIASAIALRGKHGGLLQAACRRSRPGAAFTVHGMKPSLADTLANQFQ